MKASLLAGFILLAACAAPRPQPVPAGPDPRLIAQTVALAAAQVKRCYRTPRIPREGRQIITTMRVRFTPDGMLAGLPVVVAQASVTPDNRAYGAAMADAAREAILRCQPYRLPPELYQGGWNEFDLTFSPRAIA